jgi:hypothetical protein
VFEQVEVREVQADGFRQAVLGGDEGVAGRTGLGRRGGVERRRIVGAGRGTKWRRVGRVEPDLVGGVGGVAGRREDGRRRMGGAIRGTVGPEVVRVAPGLPGEEDVAAEGVEVLRAHGWRDGRRGWRELRAERRGGRRRECW